MAFLERGVHAEKKAAAGVFQEPSPGPAALTTVLPWPDTHSVPFLSSLCRVHRGFQARRDQREKR